MHGQSPLQVVAIRGQGLGGAAEPTGPRRVHLPTAWAKRGLIQLLEGRRGGARSGRAGQWAMAPGLRTPHPAVWTRYPANGPPRTTSLLGPMLITAAVY